MLQKMRERTQGIIAGAIVALICITFALWGIQNYTHGTGGPDYIAKVNGEKITAQQLQIAYEKVRQQEYMHGNLGLDQKTQTELKQKVLKQLIDETLVTKALAKMGLEVGLDQLHAVIYSMPIFQEKGHFSPERMQQILSNMSYSEQQFDSEIQHTIMLNQFALGVVGSSFILPEEVATAAKFIGQKRDFGYFIITPDKFTAAINPTDQEINQYYEEHKNNFIIPEKISLEYIELKSSAIEDEIKSDEAQLQQFYQSNIDFYAIPKRWQIQRVLLPLSADNDKKMQDIFKQVQTGKDFTQFANKGIEWVDRNNVTADIVTELNRLAPQQVSGIIKTKDSINLIRLLAVQEQKTPVFANVKDKVIRDFHKRQLMQLFSERNDKLADLTYTNSDNLNTAAQSLGLKVYTTELFTHDGGKTGLVANPKILKAAFSEAVLKQNYNSNPIEITSGDVVVLRIKTHIPESVKSLAEVRAEIIAKLKAIKTQQQAQALGEKVINAIKANEAPAKIAQQYSLTWHSLAKIERENKQVNAQILAAAFHLPLSQNQASVIGVDLGKDGYAVIKLQEIYDGPTSVPADKFKALEQNFTTAFGEFDYYLWVNQLKKRAKITISEASLTDTGKGE